jgi:putative adhesin
MSKNVCGRDFVQPVMRRLVFAIGICALAGPAILAADSWSDETERVSQTIKLEPGGTLRVRTFSGKVTITGGDQRDVAVEAVRRAPRSRLDRIKLDVHGEGPRTVVIDANHREGSWWEFTGNNVVDTDLDIKVPRRVNLDLSVFSAPVTVDGIEGSHKLNSFSAQMTLNDVAGPIWAHTFSGPVQIRSKGVEGADTIEVQTFSGNIDLHIPDTTRAAVSFNSFSGHLNSDMPLTLRSGGRRSVKAELGGGGGVELRFKTFSGSVRIDR